MKGLLRSAFLVAATALAVSQFDGEAQQRETFTMECAGGKLGGFYQTSATGATLTIQLSSSSRNDYYGNLPAITLTGCGVLAETTPAP